MYKKKYETTTNPPIHLYINRIKNILVFRIMNGHKLELKTPEGMKLFGSVKKIKKQNKE